MRVPPLCERREDIPLLVEHFLRPLCPGRETPVSIRSSAITCRSANIPATSAKFGTSSPEWSRSTSAMARSPSAISLTTSGRSWGNIRRRWRRHLKTAVRHPNVAGLTLREISGGASQIAIETAINDEGGGLQRVAKRLGVTDRALQLRRAAGRDAEILLRADNRLTTEPVGLRRFCGMVSEGRNFEVGPGILAVVLAAATRTGDTLPRRLTVPDRVPASSTARNSRMIRRKLST